MRNTKQALQWIVNILRKKKISFLITGGLAAELYGSKRLLADIDLEIHEKDFTKIIGEVSEYVIFGPEFYYDEHWKLYLMTVRYKGQLIDICGIEHTRIFDHVTKKWRRLKINFSKTSLKSAYGLRLPIEDKSELIAYKRMLHRRVDIADVKALANL